jgi:hypothetical protein
MPQLHLKKFDPACVGDDNVLVFLGKRKTGKTFLLRDILYYHRDIPVGTIISPTEASNKFYSKMVPSLFIHDDYTPQLLESFVKRQRIMNKKVSKEMMLYNKSSLDPRAFLILDDCLYDGCWKKDKNIRFIFMNGRHIKCFLGITMQYPLGVPPDLRTNVDFVFILRENNHNNRRRIYENYASIFPTFEFFNQTMDQLTEGYGCLVIDNTSKSNKLEDNVFWYEAEDHPPFTVGSKDFWMIHNQNIADDADEEQEEEELFDIKNYARKKNQTYINIKKVY